MGNTNSRVDDKEMEILWCTMQEYGYLVRCYNQNEHHIWEYHLKPMLMDVKHSQWNSMSYQFSETKIELLKALETYANDVAKISKKILTIPQTEECSLLQLMRIAFYIGQLNGASRYLFDDHFQKAYVNDKLEHLSTYCVDYVWDKKYVNRVNAEVIKMILAL